MSKKLQIKIVTPEKLILEELVDFITVPTTEGEVTILPDHIPLIATLSSGDIVANINNESIPIAVIGGFLDVKNDKEGLTKVTILADFAEHVGDITDEEIQKAKNKAEELRKMALNKEIVDYEHFEAELEKSLNKIKIADKWRNKKYRK